MTSVHDALMVRAARREPVERTPVWFMRQAGRVLPEYLAVRERWSLIEICRQPELCAEVTMQPVRRLDVDGAVMFADIMLPLVGIGVDLELVDGVGPVIANPIRSARDLDVLREIDPAADVPFVLETIRLVNRELGGARPVIGFSGAPFTLAAYLIEGRPSRDFLRTKAMMYGEPALWHALMERLTDMAIRYLTAQIDAGVAIVQLFDSWVGALSLQDYQTSVQPYTRRIFTALRQCATPMIHFGTGTAALLETMATDGADIIGVDWRMPLDTAWQRIGHEHGIQGNLDPAALLGPRAHIAAAITDVLERADGRPGHIFNLGHGLHPGTPLGNVEYAVECVRSAAAATAAR